jgi:hypothetical protein
MVLFCVVEGGVGVVFLSLGLGQHASIGSQCVDREHDPLMIMEDVGVGSSGHLVARPPTHHHQTIRAFPPGHRHIVARPSIQFHKDTITIIFHEKIVKNLSIPRR